MIEHTSTDQTHVRLELKNQPEGAPEGAGAKWNRTSKA